MKHIAMGAQVICAIESERTYQEHKWPCHRHSVGEYLLIMEKCLADAKRAWMIGDTKALEEIRQVTAVGVAAMEQCGAFCRRLPRTRKKTIVYNHRKKYPSSK